MHVEHIEAGAKLDGNKKHRFALWRLWNPDKPLIMFIGMFPKAANENEDDDQITAAINMAKGWGYGGIYIMNLFSKIAASRKDLFGEKNNINDVYLDNTAAQCKDIVFVWGRGNTNGRAGEVIKKFPNAYSLGLNKDGTPKQINKTGNKYIQPGWLEPLVDVEVLQEKDLANIKRHGQS